MVTTSFEIHANGDGVIDITEEQRTEHVGEPQVQVNGVNGIHEEQAQEPLPPPPPPPPQPQLYDMDLERMHLELYRNRYLTPEDFLDDIRKIVHNADVRIQEDPDRLLRAQAMLTAAEVSINDFDPSFRLECQRMAVRERRRREEYRKNKEKEREKEKEAQAAEAASQAPRRSARHNGQPLDFPIPDITLIEKRNKRHRSTSAVATASEDENGDRASKRSRIDGEGVVDEPVASQSLEKATVVHFADDVNRGQPPSVVVSQSNGVLEQVPELHVLPAPIFEVAGPEATQSQAILEPPRRSGGFDPSLLNPLPSPQDLPQSGSSSAALDVENNPFLSHNTSSVSQFEPPAIQIDALSPQSVMAVDPSPADELAPAATQDIPTTQSDVAMEIHRTPSPVPDFVVDEHRLHNLRRMLRDDTASLTVEQLEQLRATCLGCVWRHRSQWDRTELISELMDNLRVFVEEVYTDDMDAPSPGQ